MSKNVDLKKSDRNVVYGCNMTLFIEMNLYRNTHHDQQGMESVVLILDLFSDDTIGGIQIRSAVINDMY